MTNEWAWNHTRATELAIEAAEFARSGKPSRARAVYQEAIAFEVLALAKLKGTDRPLIEQRMRNNLGALREKARACSF